MANGTLKFFTASVISFLISSIALSAPIELELQNGLTWEGEIGLHLQVDYVERKKLKHVAGVFSRATDMFIVVDGEMIFISEIILIKQSSDPKPSPQESDPTANNVDNESSVSAQTNRVDTADFRWTLARGTGLNIKEAEKDACRNAIEQVAGVLITAHSQIENGQLVEDIITAHSNAYILEFDTIDENIESGIVRIQINAKVAIKILFEHLSKDTNSLEFRNTDGKSMYASIVTQNRRTESAIETLPAAMRGYPEELFDIEIGKTRIAMRGVFNDGKEHLIVPVTFSWNNLAWNTFSNNLNEYLRHVSNDASSFKLRLQGLRWGEKYTIGQVYKELFDNNSWYKQGWERASLAGGNSIFGRYKINEKLKGMFNYATVNDQVVKLYTHDYIDDVVVILDSRLKSGTSFAVTREIWDSLLQRMKQVPAFYLHAIAKDDTEIGQPSSGNEFHYSTCRVSTLSLPSYTGFNFYRLQNNLPVSITDLRGNFDESKTKKSPRVMIISPYFTMRSNSSSFNYGTFFYASTYTYDFIINLELDEVHELDRVEIETYVLDLHNKRRRGNGEETDTSPSSDDNSGRRR